MGGEGVHKRGNREERGKGGVGRMRGGKARREGGNEAGEGRGREIQKRSIRNSAQSTVYPQPCFLSQRGTRALLRHYL